MEQSQDDLIALMGADNDPFVKWDASQRLAYAAIDRGAKGLERDYVDALKQVLSSDIEDAMKAQLLSLPTEASLADRAAQTGLVNVHGIHDAKTNVAAAVGHALSNELEAIVMSSLAVTDTYQPSAEQIGRRSLLHTALSLLVESDPEWLITARNMYYVATNLSDRLCAARLVVHQGDDVHRAEVLEHFFDRWQSENLVVNQWLSLIHI